MEATFPILFAIVVGFTHAFEADHIVAVSNIVTKRDRMILAIKDGIYWGLGHTSTILLIGLLFLAGRSTIIGGYGGYLESFVGVMLILLGVYRIIRFSRRGERHGVQADSSDNHREALGVGLIHGIAGSGAMILLVMTEIQGYFNGVLYLLIFGLGSILGMLVAAGILSLPFSKKYQDHPALQVALVFISSLACIIYGAYMIASNLNPNTLVF